MTARLTTQAQFAETVEVVIPAHAALVGTVLTRFRAFCEQAGISLEQSASLQLLLGETVSNAVRHGSPHGRNSRITVQWRLYRTALEIRLGDEGKFNPGSDGDECAISGRGTAALNEVADGFEHLCGEAGHTLLIRKEVQLSELAEAALRIEKEQVLDAMSRELSETYEGMVSLLHLGQVLAETVTLYDFLHRAMHRLSAVTSGYANVRLLDERRECLRMAYFDPDLEMDMALPEYLMLNRDCLEVRAFTEGKEIHLDHARGLSDQDPLGVFGGPVFVAPVHYQGRALGTIAVVKPASQKFWQAGELNLVRQLADFIGVASVNAQLHEIREQQLKTGRELEIAREIQNSLFPRKMASSPHYEVHGACQSAQMVGGDFFDVLELEDAEGVLLAMADVIGRGVPAALLATMFRTALHALRDLGAQPDVLLTELNRQFVEDVGMLDVFITAQFGFYSPKNHTLKLASAGHCPLIHLRKNGETENHIVDGFPLGLVREARYGRREIPLEPGDRLAFLTDGLYEVTNANGNSLGIPELIERLKSLAPLPPREVCSAILASVEEFALGARMTDDRTLLVFDCKA